MIPTLATVVEVLVRATPLALTGLAVAIAFRGGVWNIGADGQFLVGAAGAAAVGVFATGVTGIASLPAALLAGAIAGSAWSGIAAILRTKAGALEVISTIMLNFVAAFGVSYLVRGPMQEPTHVYPQTSDVTPAARLPIILPGTRLHAGVLIAALLALALWWVLRATAFGFRVRAIGAGAEAARISGGVNTERTAVAVFLLSGALAGLAGAVEVTGVTLALYENISPGYGYTAIAVALLGALDPIGVAIAAIGIASIETWSAALQRNSGIPSTLAAVIEACVVLGVIAAGRLRAGRTWWPASARRRTYGIDT